MKKKCSRIKTDVSPSMVSTKPMEGYRETKKRIHQRVVSDARSRSNNESHGFRSGTANGSVGVGKSEGISQTTGLGPQSSVPRTDLGNSSPLNDRRDRRLTSYKERVNIGAVNKMSVRDEFSSGSPTSSSKINASIRGPRSGSGVAPKLSPVAHRAPVSNDWKPPTAGGANNRKRTSAWSSSPPVTHWASQRPLKSSRTARRTNLVPVVSTNDEMSSLDTMSDMAGDEIGSGFARCLSSTSPQQVKLKDNALPSAVLSESEESWATEIKSKEKVKISDEIDEKAGQNVQKVSTLVLPSRKSKPMTGEDNGNGVRRQTRLSSISSRSSMPTIVEKFGNVGTTKPLRGARLGLDKAESKTGRPPTRKLTGRKAYARQKHAAIIAAADFLEDGHEELVTAVNTLISAGHAFPNSFWRQMEPFVGFVSDADIAYLKQQPDVVQMEDDEICADISKLEEKHNEQVSKKKGLLDKLLEAATETRTTQEKYYFILSLYKLALDKLVMMAYKKYMTCRGRNATGGKSSRPKMMKQAALAFVKRTLDRYHKFEDTGKSCFDEPVLRDMFLSGFFQNDNESGKPCSNSKEARKGRNGDSYAVNLPDLLPPTNQLSGQTVAKNDSWSNRVKKRELLLEDVVGGTTGTSRARSGVGSSLSSSTKGKRGERDREGKGHGREGLSRNGTNKIGRPVSNVKRERKSRAKPKQKTTQLSGSVNGLIGKISEQPKTSTSKSKLSEVTANNNAREKDEFSLDVLDDLQLPGQDLGSWLNIDDEDLQDHDFMGLEIPMDDLDDLNMIV